MSKTNKTRWLSVAAWCGAYLLLLGLVYWGMDRGRRASLRVYQGPKAQQDWEKWRAKATSQAAGDGPVQRRTPKSTEPPALVLMRDYFWQCLGGAWLVTSAVAFSIVFLIRGMLRSPTWQPLEDPVPALRTPRVTDE